MRMRAEGSLHPSASLDPSWEWGWGWVEGNATSFPLQEVHQLENVLLRGLLRWARSSATLRWASGGLGKRNEASKTPHFSGAQQGHTHWTSVLCCACSPPVTPSLHGFHFPPRAVASLLVPPSTLWLRKPLRPSFLAAPFTPSLLEPPGCDQWLLGGAEPQQNKRDNYNLGRLESQAKKHGGSSSCRVESWVWVRNHLSQPRLLERRAGLTLPFHLWARAGATSFTHVPIHSFMKCWLCTYHLPHSVWNLGTQIGRRAEGHVLGG